jgi:hypothetical protein
MRVIAIIKSLLALGLSLLLVALSSTTGHTLTGITPAVRITSVSGYAGHAFVYAEVNDAGIVFPAPTGTTHASPFYGEWIREPSGLPSCPWIWAVYVFNRDTGLQINPAPPNSSTWNFGTTTMVCASPTGTPVDQPPVADASARLDLDLQVAVSPPVVTAGSPSVVSAVLSSSLTQDLDLYLNMAIRDWSVTTWAIDFGDGHAVHVDGQAGAAIAVPHTYVAAGQYDARAVAYISGHAQAAIYDRYGNVRLITQPFSVEVGNHALTSARAQAARRYLPPQVVITVTPSLSTAVPDPPGNGFRHIDALRGSLTRLRVQALVLREALLTVGGNARGLGRSRLTAWRLDGSPSDAPAGSGTMPGRIHPTGDPLVLQWNAPDRVVFAQPQDYVVPVTLFVETRFPDGHLASYAIPSSFSVTVNFAAESG